MTSGTVLMRIFTICIPLFCLGGTAVAAELMDAVDKAIIHILRDEEGRKWLMEDIPIVEGEVLFMSSVLDAAAAGKPELAVYVRDVIVWTGYVHTRLYENWPDAAPPGARRISTSNRHCDVAARLVRRNAGRDPEPCGSSAHWQPRTGTPVPPGKECRTLYTGP